MQLSNLEKRDAKGKILPADLRNYARTVRLRTTIFGKVTHVEEGCRYSHPKDRGASVPQIIRDPYSTSIPFDFKKPNSVIKLNDRKIFTGSATPRAPV